MVLHDVILYNSPYITCNIIRQLCNVFNYGKNSVWWYLERTFLSCANVS